MTAKVEPAFNDVAMTVLKQRYLQKDAEGNVWETPMGMLERVSMGNPDYYDIMAQLWFLPNTPTLVNLGRENGRGTLSACFKFDVPDDMEGILALARKAGMVLTYGGGVGYAFGAVRPKGSIVRGTSRHAGGPMAFMPIYHALAMGVEQGGVRPGAQMAILPWDHADVWDFITSKDTLEKAKQLSTFNISVAAEDRFMHDIVHQWEDADKFGGPRESWKRLQGLALGEQQNMFKLFTTIVHGAWQTGDPGFYFIDTAEKSNPTPWLGKLTGTNPCGEVPLLDNEACNLGSINLGKFVYGSGHIDYDGLRHTAIIATRFLDDILDHNQFPDPAITEAVRKTRKLGLGVMGFADMLALMGVPYDSHEAVAIGEEVMKTIDDAAFVTSHKLGQEKGAAPAYDDALYETGNVAYAAIDNLARRQQSLGLRVEGQLMQFPRNTTVTCIAPTGTIATLAAASNGIEPYYALKMKRRMANGTILDIAPWPLEDEMVPVGHRPAVAEEIGWGFHIAHQAAFQRHVDLATSKTVNMPFEATEADIAGAYIEAWRQGCKGVTIFRNGSRGTDQVLTSAGSEEKEKYVSVPGASPSPIVAAMAHDLLDAHDAHIDAQMESLVPGYAGSVPGYTARSSASPASPDAAGDPPLAVVQAEALSRRRSLPSTRRSVTHKFHIGDAKVYFTVGLYEDGSPGEIFIKCNREGSTVSGLLDSFGIMFSKGLQYGVPLVDSLQRLVGMRFEPSGMTDNRDIPIATSILDYVARWMLAEFGGRAGKEAALPMYTGVSCPDCGSETVSQGGCLTCATGCGWSKCG